MRNLGRQSKGWSADQFKGGAFSSGLPRGDRLAMDRNRCIGLSGRICGRALFIIPEAIINSLWCCVYKQGVYKPVYKHTRRWVEKQVASHPLPNFRPQAIQFNAVDARKKPRSPPRTGITLQMYQQALNRTTCEVRAFCCSACLWETSHLHKNDTIKYILNIFEYVQIWYSPGAGIWIWIRKNMNMIWYEYNMIWI